MFKKFSFRTIIGVFCLLVLIVVVITYSENGYANARSRLKPSDQFEKYQEALLKGNYIRQDQLSKFEARSNEFGNTEKSHFGSHGNGIFHDYRGTEQIGNRYDKVDIFNEYKHGNIPEQPTRTTSETGKYVQERNSKEQSMDGKIHVDKIFSNWLQTITDDGTVRDCITGNELYSYDRTLKPFVSIDTASMKSTYSEDTGSRQASFVEVFESRAWGHGWDPQYQGLNASGRGSTLDWTQEVIAGLHLTINAVKQKLNKTRVSILDIPCGDFAWMSRFLKTRNDVHYTGMDIVPSLISHHQKTYKHKVLWKFIHADILHETVSIGKYDIIICRMMLQHLYDQDVIKLLQKFSESGSKYILLTTFSCHRKNQQLLIEKDNPGRFRPINLQLEPFYMRPPLCLLRDGAPDVIKAWEHYMGLWSLPLTTVKDCKVNNFRANTIPCELYAC